MMLDLDLIAGLLALFICACAATLHIVSDPTRHEWLSVPKYVRRASLVAIAMMLWRGVNLLSLSERPTVLPGHANAEAVMSWASLAALLGALTYWLVSTHFPSLTWSALGWVRRPAANDD